MLLEFLCLSIDIPGFWTDGITIIYLVGDGDLFGSRIEKNKPESFGDYIFYLAFFYETCTGSYEP